MELRFSASFERSLKSLPPTEKDAVKQAAAGLVRYFSTGERPLGLGLRKLKTPYWEIRASLSLRALFRLEDRHVTFVFAGNHDQVKRLLRGY